MKELNEEEVNLKIAQLVWSDLNFQMFNDGISKFPCPTDTYRNGTTKFLTDGRFNRRTVTGVYHMTMYLANNCPELEGTDELLRMLRDCNPSQALSEYILNREPKVSSAELTKQAYNNLVQALDPKFVEQLDIAINSETFEGYKVGFEYDNKTNINSPAAILIGAFDWGEAPQPTDYWIGVHEDLERKERS